MIINYNIEPSICFRIEGSFSVPLDAQFYGHSFVEIKNQRKND